MTKPAWDGWYKTRRWQAVRARIVLRDLYTCQRCGITDGRKGALAVHHKQAHKGNEAAFWCDDDGLETLCKQCHDGHEQSIEKGGNGRAIIGADGWPVTP